MRFHIEAESYEALHREVNNSWEKYLLRSTGVCRIISGVALTLFPTLLTNPDQAQAGSRACPFGDETLVQGWMGRRYAGSPGVSETLTTQVIPSQDGHSSMATLSPLKSLHRPPRFTSPLNIVSSPSAQLLLGIDWILSRTGPWPRAVII